MDAGEVRNSGAIRFVLFDLAEHPIELSAPLNLHPAGVAASDHLDRELGPAVWACVVGLAPVAAGGANERPVLAVGSTPGPFSGHEGVRDRVDSENVVGR